MKESRKKILNEDLLKLIPPRQMKETKDFVENAKNPEPMYYTEKDPVANNGKKTMLYFDDLTDVVRERQKSFDANANGCSQFCYIAHQKMDGILSAKILAEKLCGKDKKKPDLVYNPRVDEKNLSAHIKWSRLRDKALAEDLVKREKLPLTGIILSVTSGIVLLLDLLGKTFELTHYTGDNAFLNILKSFNAGIVLTCVLIALIAASVGLIIIHTRKNRKALSSKINKVLHEMDTKEFADFLSSFGGSDLMIPDCDGTNATVFLCVLQNYSPKEHYILSAYWRSASHGQLWWIFAEATSESERFLVPPAKDYERHFYFQEPLGKKGKRKIADKIYCERTRILPADDSGIKNYGVDYLYRFHLELEPIADIEQLNEKIDQFCRFYATSYQTDIKLVIRLVADLACTYGFDFSIRRNWEYLFNDNLGDPLLNKLDKQVTDALNLNNKAFRNLIPEILDVFSKDLEEIVAEHPNSEQTSEYEQWCIIKALKTRATDPEECYLSICDTLMAEFKNCEQNPEDIGASVLWRDVLVKTSEIFYEKQFFWFLPTLLHNLLIFYAGKSGQRLFSQSVILEIARANLLLGLQDGENASIDPVREHYEIVCAAVAEQHGAERLADNASVPPAFELLQFTNFERRRYYNALRILKEQMVIDFVDCLFDMFAAISADIPDAKFCYSVLYEESLYVAYLEKSGRTTTHKNYIIAISNRLLSLLDDSFGEKVGNVKSSIRSLQAVLNEGRPVNELLLLVVELDVLGFNTLNFIACMMGLADNSKELSRDIYLNLGNSLLGVVFLAYYELRQPTFYNEDFKYLIALCTGYSEPGSAVLGFLCFCDTRLKPANSHIHIQEYIRKHKATYLESLCNIASRIKRKDLEDFITFLSCIKVASTEETVPIYEALQKKIEASFAADSQSKFYLELISLTLTQSSTDEFAGRDPGTIIEDLLTQSPNMVFLLYEQYRSLFEEEYAVFCHAVAPRIVNSVFSQRLEILIIDMIKTESSSSPENMASTSQLIFSALDKEMHLKGLEDLAIITIFLRNLEQRRQNVPELYDWTTETAVFDIWIKAAEQKINAAKQLIKAFCDERKWTSYGLAMYLRELLFSNDCDWHIPEGYLDKGDGTQKTAYIIEHFGELCPLIVVEERLCVSRPYMDMVKAFITNEGDIQHVLDEKECMRKLTKDLLTVVENYKALDEEEKSRVRHLITEYRRQFL